MSTDFIHVGLTVSDIDKTIEFYEKYFGFELRRRGVFSEGFIGALPQFYRQKKGVYAENAFISSPNGIVLELFRFSDILPGEEAVWNKPSYHHICLKVPSVQKVYEELIKEGVEFCFPPRVKGDPKNNEYWVFLKDPDGNLIELQD